MKPTTARVAAALPLALLALPPAFLGGACGTDAVTLPTGYSTGRYRKITIRPNEPVEGRTARVQALNGMDGAPKPVVGGDADLRTRYWGRLTGSTEADGAHVRMVRVGTDTLCDLSLEGIFPSAGANPELPASYNFQAIDQHVKSITELHTATILWQAAFNPGRGTCTADAQGRQSGSPIASQSDSDLWVTTATHTLQHLRGDSVSDWDSAGKKNYNVRYVEFLDDPVGQMGYPANATDPTWNLFLQTYKNFAERVKTEWPDTQDADGNPIVKVHVGGSSFGFTSPGQLDYTSDANKHPLLRFIDFAAEQDVPLDFVSFKTQTQHPYQAYEIAQAIRDYLDGAQFAGRFADTELIATAIEPTYPASFGSDSDPAFRSAFLGTFQTATRNLYEDVPVQWALAGRGPRVFSDLKPHINENLDAIRGLIVDSDYFQFNTATAPVQARPSFVGLFPFRQIAGHQRVKVTEGGDLEGMSILASHDVNTDKVLHVIIANANVHTGMAEITYDLQLDRFVPPTIPQVEYKLAVLDRNSWGVGAFHFSETGVLNSTAQTGTVRFVHQMAVPSIHYIQFVKP